MGDRITPPFVSMALAVCDRMQIHEPKTRGIVMGFCKRYQPEKIARIVAEAEAEAETYPWREKNPGAAFMKAVGVINKNDKK